MLHRHQTFITCNLIKWWSITCLFMPNNTTSITILERFARVPLLFNTYPNTCAYHSQLFSLFLCFFWRCSVITSSAQGLFLAQCTGLTPGSAWEDLKQCQGLKQGWLHTRRAPSLPPLSPWPFFKEGFSMYIYIYFHIYIYTHIHVSGIDKFYLYWGVFRIASY